MDKDINKITRLTIEDGKMCLKLGGFVSLGNQWVNIWKFDYFCVNSPKLRPEIKLFS